MKLHTIGQTVKEAMRCGQEIPEIVQDDPTDSMVVRKLKNIIQSMTKADPKQRQQLFIVQDELQDEIDCMGKCSFNIAVLSLVFYCVNTTYLVDRCYCPAPCRSRQTLEKNVLSWALAGTGSVLFIRQLAV